MAITICRMMSKGREGFIPRGLLQIEVPDRFPFLHLRQYRLSPVFGICATIRVIFQ